MANGEVSLLLKYAYLNEAVLATGLAYLALEVTRYTKRVSVFANTQIAAFESTTQPEVLAQLRKTDYWRKLLSYSQFERPSLLP